jgi:dephospho-CoA kinase
MLKVGITGNIGSGKSTVARIFSQLGIPIYDADSRAKAVMLKPALVTAIKQLLGSESYSENGELNRAFISQKVFNNSALLTQLNALVHPAVFLDFDEWILDQTAPYILKEAALLIESNSYKNLDLLIVVLADHSIRLERSMKRDGADEASILARMNAQMPQEDKAKLARFVINNNDDLLIPQVLEIHQQILELAR